MSWAGKQSFKDYFRSLFPPREQAPSFSVGSSSRELMPHTVEKVEQLLQAWIRGKGYRMPDRSIEEAARRIGTDSATLYHYFCAHGEDFRSFRTRLRIEDAMAQLRAEPSTPASTIAHRVGYRDRSNFTRHFKAHTGLTPDAWRKSVEK